MSKNYDVEGKYNIDTLMDYSESVLNNLIREYHLYDIREARRVNYNLKAKLINSTIQPKLIFRVSGTKIFLVGMECPESVSDVDVYIPSFVYGVNFMSTKFGRDISIFENKKRIKIRGGSGLVDFTSMFNGCGDAEVIDLSEFEGSRVKVLNHSFNDCNSITELNLSCFKDAKIESIAGAFKYCTSLSSLDLSMIDISAVKSLDSTFEHCYSLKDIKFKAGIICNKLTSMIRSFAYCSGLTSLDLSIFNTSRVRSFNSLFSNCYNLSKLDLSSFKTERALDMGYMMYNCGLEYIDLSSFRTPRLQRMRCMFARCKRLKGVDISHFDITCLVDVNNMFENCPSLCSIGLPKGIEKKDINRDNMFRGCRIDILPDWYIVN